MDRHGLCTRSEITVEECSKAVYFEIYANLQLGKTYFSITSKEGAQQHLDFRKRDVLVGHIVSGSFFNIA